MTTTPPRLSEHFDDLTQIKIEGSGLFDELMQSVKSHLQEEYDKQRIRGADYTQAYVASMQAAMGNAVQYLIGMRLIDAELTKIAADTVQVETQTKLVEEQIRQQAYITDVQLPSQVLQTNTQTNLIEEQIRQQGYITDVKLPAEVAQINIQSDLIGEQIKEQQYVTNFKLPAEVRLIGSQTTQVEAQTNLTNAQTTTETTMLPLKVDQTIAQTNQVREQTKLVVAQTTTEETMLPLKVAQTTAQTVQLEEQTKLVVAQTATETTMLPLKVAQTTAQTAQIEKQTLQVTEQTKLVVAQTKTEEDMLPLRIAESTAKTNQTDKQSLLLVAQTETANQLRSYEIDKLDQEIILGREQAGMVTEQRQSEKYKRESILPQELLQSKETVRKITAEVDLINAKKAEQTKQLSVMDSQIALYREQAKAYADEIEVKYAKIRADAWGATVVVSENVTGGPSTWAK